ncbi:hypothetical protein F5Y19DRAFT_226142 [Xylariaceae sp. FL1651]|nr:hypothetical protein F5Y19DRAFT_226142 [Xylariaceae sp. FL1651]
MATNQPAATVLGAPRQQPQTSQTQWDGIGPEPSQPVEFRGFDFFSKRDFNQLKDASRAYYGMTTAEKQGNPSSWLGDATPPATAHQSLDEARPVDGRFPIALGGKTPPEKKIVGLRRPWFWTLLAIIAVVVIVAIGVGVGVGVSQRTSSGSKGAVGSSPSTTTATTSAMVSSGTPAVSSMPMAASSTSPTGTPTTSTRAPTSTMEIKTDCPAANGTIYHVPGSTKQFLRICGIDYGNDGAVDIRNVPTDNAADCIDNCAGTTGCTGCGWGFIDGDQGSEHRCWMKSNLKKAHDADMDWAFAMLL